MKRTMVIAFLAFRTMAAFGQNGADMSVDSLTIHPDIMTFFQGEMTSLMRFQAEKERVVPFFVGASLNYDLRSLSYAGGNHEDYYVILMNGLIGFQIRLGQHLYLPVYGAFAGSSSDGKADDGVLLADDGSPLTDASRGESDVNILGGSGLYFTAGPFTGGLFAAYHLKNTYLQIGGQKGGSSYKRVDEDTRHTFKLAFLPMVNTSGWKYVGLILDNVLGYVGMGDVVSTAENDKDQNISDIVSALNYALDLGFSRFELGNVGMGLHAFYRRDSYDAVARNDVYGGELKVLFPPFTKFSLGTSAEIGYRHFNAVEPAFASKYEDRLFYKLGLFMFTKSTSSSISVQYDSIWRINFFVDFSRAFTLMGGMGVGTRNYKSANRDVKEENIGGAAGVRYRANSGFLEGLRQYRKDFGLSH